MKQKFTLSIFIWLISFMILPSVLIAQNANAGADQTICATTTILNGNTPGTGTFGNWTVALGNAIIVDPTNPTTSVTNLGNGTNIFQWTFTGNNTTSDQVNIINDSPDPAYAGSDFTVCSDSAFQAANMPAIGTGAWTFTSGNAIFQDYTDPYTLATGLFLGANVLRWTITNNACSSYDEITITNNQVNANAGVDQILCVDNTILDATAPQGDEYGNWSIISGVGIIVNSTLYNSAVTNLAPDTLTLAWNVAKIDQSCFGSDEVKIFRDSVSANAGFDDFTCSQQAFLYANIPDPHQGQWTLISGGGTFVDETYYSTEVNGIPLGANTYRWTVSSPNCTAFDEVVISNDSIVMNAGPDQFTCSDNVILNGTVPQADESGTWYLLNGIGTIVEPSLYNTSVTGLLVDTLILEWDIMKTNESCYNYDSLIIVRDSVVANAGLDSSVCDNYFYLNANMPLAGQTGTWTIISGGGNFDDINSPYATISNLLAGDNVLEWRVNGACEDRDTVIIRYNIPIADAGLDFTACTNTAGLSALQPLAGETGIWTVLSGQGILADSTLYNSTISSLNVGTNILRWTVDNGICAPSMDSLIITRDSLVANAGADQTVCVNSAILMGNKTQAGESGMWTVLGGTGSFVNPALDSTEVNGLSIGANTFEWKISTTNCNATDNVIVTYNQVVANAGTDFTVCTDSALLNASAPLAGESGSWSKVGGTGIFANDTLFNTEITNLNVGTNTLIWTISSANCSNADTLIVTSEIVTANAGADQTVCVDNATLTATTPTIGNGMWTLQAGTGIIANPSLNSTTVTGLSNGVNTFEWKVSTTNCNAADNVSITSEIVTANAGADQTVCVDNATLTATTPAIGNGMWTLQAGAGIIANPSLNSTTVTGLSNGVNTFEWKVSTTNCNASDNVSITSEIVTANAGADQTVCVDNATLTATTPTIGNGMWTLQAGAGIVANPSLNSTTVTGLSNGVNTFEWKVSTTNCNATDNVSITSEIVTANAGADQTVCVDNATLTATTPTIGNGMWTLQAGAGIIANPSLSSTTVTGLSNGVNTFEWKVSTTNCNATDNVLITRETIIANAGVDQSTCGSSVQMTATLGVDETGIWTSTSNAVIANINDALTYVEGFDQGTNTFTWTVSNSNCSTSDDVIIENLSTNPQYTFVVNGSDVDFTASANGTALKWFWTFDDGQTSNLQNPVHSYTQSGLYNVCLTVIDTLNDCQATICQDIEVGTVNCIADFNYSILDLQVNFTDISTGSPLIWNWTFGDGESSSEQNPTHTYLEPGSYTVSLTTYDPINDCLDEEIKEIKVGTIPCLADFEAFVEPDIKTVSLTNLASGDINAYFWSFGDNQYSNTFESDHIYQQDGVYEICLTVFNTSTGCQSQTCQNIQIGNNEVKADFKYLSSDTSLTVELKDASTGTVNNWYWVFGDGSFAQGKDQTKTFANPGIYNISLKVLDEASGKTSEITKAVQVGQVSCNLSADFSYYYNNTTGEVSFSNLSYGNANLWSWQFDDGTSSSEKSPTHTFTQAGFYLVSLAIQNETSGCEDTKYKFIQIGSVDCYADFDYTVDPTTLTVNYTDKSDGNIGTHYWSFGDASYSEEISPTHTYSAPGLYPVYLSIADASGLCADFREDYVQVGEVNCDAKFNVFVNNQTQNVDFTSEVLGEISSYRWMFGDGSISDNPNPNHHYQHQGYYYVNLLTFNEANNCASNYSKTILVGDEGSDCEANFYHQTNAATREVQFTDNSKGTNLSYVWDFGDGTSSTERNPSHQFVDAGQHYVCLTVTNGAGIPNMTCKNVSIGNACEAVFSYSVDGLSVQFGDISKGNPTEWAWSFGDGSQSTEQNPNYTYTTEGNYLIDLQIGNNSGCAHRAIDIISVGNTDDTTYFADFIFEEDTSGSKPSGYPVDMFGTGKGDTPNAKWNFGDKQKTGYAENATTLWPTYVYTNPGNYEVCLTVEDPISGQSYTSCHTVTAGATAVNSLEWTGAQFSVYPNPVVNSANIEFSSTKNAHVKLAVYNMFGKLVKEIDAGEKMAGSSSMTMEVSDLSPGIYYLEMQSEHGSIGQKLLINR